jgi:integrase
MCRLGWLTAPRARAMLLRLPVELMRRAKLPDTTPREAARLARMAVMVEILSVCPIRLASLRAIRIDHSLLRLGNHGRLTSHLRIEAADTKTGQEVQWPLPLESAKLLETYITHHRPSLVPDANLYLFPGEGLEPLSHNGLRESLGRTIDRLIGITVTPHLFRHFAAYNFLTTNPGQYELVRRVLGHASVETTIANYCGLEADAAAKVFDDMLLRQRRETRSIADAAFRQGRGGKAGRS